MARLVEFNEEQAIQKAMEVFWKKGYAQTSMRDLTDAMQINASSLYNTIGDKEKLFVKCIQEYTKMRIKNAKEQSIDLEDPLLALENFIRDAAKIIVSEPNACLCVKAAFETEGRNEEVNAVVNSFNLYNHQLVRSLIEKAQQLGQLPANNLADVMADYVLSVIGGWYSSFITDRDTNKILKMAEFVIGQVKK